MTIFFMIFFKAELPHQFFLLVVITPVHYSMVLGGKIKLIIYINVKSGSFKQDEGTQEWSPNSNFCFKDPYNNMIFLVQYFDIMFFTFELSAPFLRMDNSHYLVPALPREYNKEMVG